MDSKPSHIPVDEAQLSRWTERANALLVQVKWSPRIGAAARAPGDSVMRFRESAVGNIAAEDTLSLLTIAKQAGRDPVLVAEPANHALTEVRQGLRIGMHLSNLYTTASGLQTLIDLNTRGGMSDEQKTEFRAKYETASAITVFACACHVRWALGDYMAQEVSGVTMEAPPITEVHLLNPVRALDCTVYHYAASLDKSGLVHTPVDFVKMTLLYFEALAEEIRVRSASLRFTEPFTTRSYQVAGTEFAIHGFETDFLPRESSIEFNRVDIGEIVGNRDAKHKARRLAERLICYDAATRRNPMLDLGGLQTLRMGHGEPGTGKSLQIAATATMLDEYGRIIGVPFLFWPMPDTIVEHLPGRLGRADDGLDEAAERPDEDHLRADRRRGERAGGPHAAGGERRRARGDRRVPAQHRRRIRGQVRQLRHRGVHQPARPARPRRAVAHHGPRVHRRREERGGLRRPGLPVVAQVREDRAGIRGHGAARRATSR